MICEAFTGLLTFYYNVHVAVLQGYAVLSRHMLGTGEAPDRKGWSVLGRSSWGAQGLRSQDMTSQDPCQDSTPSAFANCYLGLRGVYMKFWALIRGFSVSRFEVRSLRTSPISKECSRNEDATLGAALRILDILEATLGVGQSHLSHAKAILGAILGIDGKRHKGVAFQPNL